MYIKRDGKRVRMPELSYLVRDMLNTEPPGGLILVTGTMAGGKSREIVAALHIAYQRLNGKGVQLFRPGKDSRMQVSRDRVEIRYPVEAVINAAELERKVQGDTKVVGIDEAHFLDAGIVELCRSFVTYGKVVVVGTLLFDFRGEDMPFMQGEDGRTVMDLLRIADQIVPQGVVNCNYVSPEGRTCNRLASQVQRYKVGNPANVLLASNASDRVHIVDDKQSEWLYAPVCTHHHFVPGSRDKHRNRTIPESASFRLS